jgi:hypothetical protein
MGTYRREEKCVEKLVGKSEGKKPLGRCRHRWKLMLK